MLSADTLTDIRRIARRDLNDRTTQIAVSWAAAEYSRIDR